MSGALEPNALGRSGPPLHLANCDDALSGSVHRFGDYATDERIDHRDRMTVAQAEDQIASRLYQNTARIHIDGARQQRSGRRVAAGGHGESLVRGAVFQWTREGVAHSGHQGSALRRLSRPARRILSAGRHSRPGLLGADTALRPAAPC